MLVRDAMTASCKTCAAEATVRDAARMMDDHDIGVMPIEQDNRLVGMLTDRDIVVRGVARGIQTDTVKATDLMSEEVLYCYDDQQCDEVAANLAEMKIRRVPVVDRQKNLVGTLTLGDISRSDVPRAAAQALAGITKPD